MAFKSVQNEEKGTDFQPVFLFIIIIIIICLSTTNHDWLTIIQFLQLF